LNIYGKIEKKQAIENYCFGILNSKATLYSHCNNTRAHMQTFRNCHS
jgi:hypothetical protein